MDLFACLTGPGLKGYQVENENFQSSGNSLTAFEWTPYLKITLRDLMKICSWYLNNVVEKLTCVQVPYQVL